MSEAAPPMRTKAAAVLAAEPPRRKASVAGHVGAALDGPRRGDDDIEQQVTQGDEARSLLAHGGAAYVARASAVPPG